MKASDFPYCHPEIASILALVRTDDGIKSDASHISRDDERITIDFPASSTINDLIEFAIECENVVFQSKTSCPPIQQNCFLQSLIEYSRSSSHKNTAPTTVSTLLALNFLESAIRHTTGHSTGRAPLLKSMISEIPDTNIRKVTELLLLPTGLNLRNLLW